MKLNSWLNALSFPAKRYLGLGSEPDFVLIGAMKCGTTALYNTLVQHPSVYAARQKEIRFFDRRFHKGIRWYRANFPSPFFKPHEGDSRKGGFLTGEATVDYILHPHAPQRISHFLPRVKVLVLLRNPIERAFSHYHHILRNGGEDLPFEEALRMEEERLRGEIERMLRDERYEGRKFFLYSYKTRGVYIEQLKRWYACIPKDRILIAKSEEYKERPHVLMSQIADFLGLPRWDGFIHGMHNKGNYASTMNSRTREQLRAFYEPYNQRLYEFLGMDYEWR